MVVKRLKMDVEQHLKTILETGKLAEKQLEIFRKTEKEKKF